MQVSIMNSRVIALLAGRRERWPLAGDNLLVDFDLSEDHLSPGDRISLGAVVLQITDEAHNGCRKFAERFGKAGLQFVNSHEGKRFHLRGIYGRIIDEAAVEVGDEIAKLGSTA